jgi:hypothetical protein
VIEVRTEYTRKSQCIFKLNPNHNDILTEFFAHFYQCTSVRVKMVLWNEVVVPKQIQHQLKEAEEIFISRSNTNKNGQKSVKIPL